MGLKCGRTNLEIVCKETFHLGYEWARERLWVCVLGVYSVWSTVHVWRSMVYLDIIKRGVVHRLISIVHGSNGNNYTRQGTSPLKLTTETFSVSFLPENRPMWIDTEKRLGIGVPRPRGLRSDVPIIEINPVMVPFPFDLVLHLSMSITYLCREKFSVLVKTSEMKTREFRFR